MHKEIQIQPYQLIKLIRMLKSGNMLTFLFSILATGGLMEKLQEGRKNYFKEGGNLYPQFDPIEAYKRSLKTWGEWIDNNIDPKRQMVFYRGYSSAHFRGGDWNSGGTCNGEKEPILGSIFRDSYPLQMKFLEDVMQNMKVPVIFLNVTRLTNFRKDGHPSVYGKTRKQDCSHWCLPGVPDAWNELIYATLVYQQSIIS